MKTTYKIGAARVIYHAVHAGRTLLGRTDREIVVRDGIMYDLDLSQGIDFAIYLGGMFERATAVALTKLTEPSPRDGVRTDGVCVAQTQPQP
jgi:hypothetical protein